MPSLKTLWRNSSVYLVIAAIGIAMALAVQYPLLTTFPIGGDAASVIRVTRDITQNLPWRPVKAMSALAGSSYPLSHLLLSLSAILPTDWPDRYVWAMSISQLIVTAALGLLARRIGGWPAGAMAMIIWSLTIISINNHFEDGTIAQLLSLAFLLLFFERIWAGSLLAGPLFLALFFVHPLTGMMGLLTVFFSLPVLFFVRKSLSDQEKRTAQQLAWAAVPIFFLVIWSMVSHKYAITIPYDNHSIRLVDILHSPFGIFILLAPAGLGLFILKIKDHPLAVILVTMFTSLAILLTFNNLLSVGLWTFRFQTYTILAVAIMASLAFIALLNTIFPRAVTRLLWTILFVSTLTVTAWNANTDIYARYESPIRYLRLHPQERAALDWLNGELTTPGMIYTVTASRHAEWIPILTHHGWEPIKLNQIYTLPFSDLSAESGINSNSLSDGSHYLMIFLKTEGIPPVISSHQDLFPQVFKNDGAAIFQLPFDLPVDLS